MDYKEERMGLIKAGLGAASSVLADAMKAAASNSAGAMTGLLGGFIATGNMKGKLKSVASQDKAANYIKNGSLKVTQSKDVFLYVHVDRKKRVQQTRNSGSSTHVSSSGKVHGGGGGRF